MPDFGRWSSNGGDPSLNAIARTDRFLDALSSEQPAYSADPGDAALANLLAGWRDELREPPATGLVSQRDAVAALDSAVSSRRRTRAAMAVVGSLAAALLCLGGFGAVVYGAGPGDALYGLHTMLFGQQQATRDDQVVLAAQTQLSEVQQLIDQGQWSAAQDKLVAVSSTVQTVDNGARKQELLDQMNRLSVKVEKRDPNATLPPPAQVPPSAGVPQVPAIVGPSTSSSETTTSSSGTTSSSETTTSSSTSSSTSTTSSPPVQQPPAPTTTSSSPPTTTTTTRTPTTTTTTAPTTTTTTSTSAAGAPALGGGSNAEQPPTSSSAAPAPHSPQGPQGPETAMIPVTTTTFIQLPLPAAR